MLVPKQTEQTTTYISHFPYTVYNFNYKENFFFLYPVISVFNKPEFAQKLTLSTSSLSSHESNPQKTQNFSIGKFSGNPWNETTKHELISEANSNKNIENQEIQDSATFLKRSKDHFSFYREFINWNKNFFVPIGELQTTDQSLNIFFSFEKIFSKNFLWNSKNMALRILNNSLFPLASNRQFKKTPSKFVLKHTSSVLLD